MSLTDAISAITQLPSGVRLVPVSAVSFGSSFVLPGAWLFLHMSRTVPSLLEIFRDTAPVLPSTEQGVPSRALRLSSAPVAPFSPLSPSASRPLLLCCCPNRDAN